jgi:hypothetical protein
MRHRLTLTAVGAGLLSLPSVAHACRDDGAMTSTIRREIPWSESGQTVAEVEVDGLVDAKHFRWGAKIIRMIKGEYSGTRMIIVPASLNSCNSFPRDGDRGFVVGWVIDSSSNALVLKALSDRSLNDLAAAAAASFGPKELANVLGEFSGQRVMASDIRRLSCTGFEGGPVAECTWQQRRGKAWTRFSAYVSFGGRSWYLTDKPKPID